MINNIPENWTYSDDLEMLFYFYQCTDELLSETSPDSFALPLHNTITLINELTEIYSLLKKYDIVKEYYERYIPPIIDEFFHSMTEDYVLKSMLGERLDSILTVFEEREDTRTRMTITNIKSTGLILYVSAQYRFTRQYSHFLWTSSL